MDVERGIISREIFVSDEIYAREQAQIFNRAWLFIGHESQISRPGDFLASSAYLEAASVHAFRWMAEEIEAHGLGAELAAWARRAAKEEARHARMMTSLARTLGHPTIPKVEKPAPRLRSLETIALENAVEGCVRECRHQAHGAPGVQR